MQDVAGSSPVSRSFLFLRLGRRGQVAKAKVCKTFIHRFESGRRLFSFLEYSSFLSAGQRFFAVVFALSFFFPALSSARENIDRILGIINDQPITHSDILAHDEILQRIRHSIFPANEILTGSEIEQRRKIFKEIVVRLLIYPEAVKLNLAEVDPEILETEYQLLYQSFESDAHYQRFCYLLGLRDEQVRFLIRQYLVCKEYIKKKIGLQVRINLKSYYLNNRDRYPEIEFEQLKPAVEKDLYQVKLDSWLADVLARAKVRIINEDYKDALQ